MSPTVGRDTPPAKISGVLNARAGDTFETFALSKNPGMLKALEQCQRVGRGEARSALLAGPPGTGKTHLAVAAMNEYGMQRSYFWKVPDFLEWLRVTSYGEKVGVIRALKSYVEQDFLLVLDDLGVQKDTDWVDEQLYRVLDARCDGGLPTIITTNQPANRIDDRLLSRYASGLVVCTGKDMRR